MSQFIIGINACASNSRGSVLDDLMIAGVVVHGNAQAGLQGISAPHSHPEIYSTQLSRLVTVSTVLGTYRLHHLVPRLQAQLFADAVLDFFAVLQRFGRKLRVEIAERRKLLPHK
jgi:hypothetical protein